MTHPAIIRSSIHTIRKFWTAREIAVRWLALVFTLSLIALPGCDDPSPPDSVSVQDMFPGESWALPMENMGPLQGSPGITARDCGSCHTEHYREWSQSTHAHALSPSPSGKGRIEWW